MTGFFFNDCLPKNKTISEYATALHHTLRAYVSLANKHDIELVISTNQDELALSDVISLKSCILSLGDSVERAFAMRTFSRYPVDAFFPTPDYEEELIEEDFYVEDDSQTRHNAINLACVHLNNGVLFSLGVECYLCQNTITVKGTTKSYDVPNLWGEESNTLYISTLLREIKERQKTTLDQIKDILGSCCMRDTFLEDFNSFATGIQKGIKDKFQNVTDQNMLHPVKADKKQISDVTPSNGEKGPLYELRVFSPEVVRVYFIQKAGKLVLIDVCTKGDQDRDIRRAYNRI